MFCILGIVAGDILKKTRTGPELVLDTDPILGKKK